MSKRSTDRMKKTLPVARKRATGYRSVLKDMTSLLDQARHASARAVNVVMTATYWELGRRIAQEEMAGSSRANYGEELIDRLAADLTERFGRGFGRRNLFLMRGFYMAWPNIVQTVSAQLAPAPKALPRRSRADGIVQTVSAQFKRPTSITSKANTIATLELLSEAFPLPWSHYVRLLTVEDRDARSFYETEALRAGWSVRQLDRQVSTRFYERTLASRNKVRMLQGGAKARKGEMPSAEEEVRDPYMLEFLGLKDEYSESDLEEALVRHLENFLMELGSDFAFVGRQRRLRIGGEWYRVDLIVFNRRLRCLVVIDLKVGRFTHADPGQMNLYLNYARKHWAMKGENPPVGLILCTEHDDAVARYALDGLKNKVMARAYKLALPKEKKLEEAIEKARRMIERRKR